MQCIPASGVVGGCWGHCPALPHVRGSWRVLGVLSCSAAVGAVLILFLVHPATAGQLRATVGSRYQDWHREAPLRGGRGWHPLNWTVASLHKFAHAGSLLETCGAGCASATVSRAIWRWRCCSIWLRCSKTCKFGARFEFAASPLEAACAVLRGAVIARWPSVA